MGRKNVSGTRVQCQHCGYTWYTQSQEEITSCPRCGWRVRIREKRSRAASTRQSLTGNRPREPLI